METSNLVSIPIVKELLTRQNYIEWRVWIQNYLLGQDLWDVVENTANPSNPVWRRKNAAALHAIKMSCGQEALSLIMNIPSAKFAWDALTTEYMNLPRSSVAAITPGGTSNISSVIKPYDLKYAPLYKAVCRGDWKAANEFLKAHPEGVRARITDTGTTALHVAASFGHLHIVEELVELMSEQDMELKDFNGLTVLTTAANTGIIKVAECLIRKNKNLPIIPNISSEIPALKAALNGHLEMARYLYLVTPIEELSPEKGCYGATFLTQCVFSNVLDLALDLLQHCPRLAITPDNQGGTLALALSSKPSLFPSGCLLLFWQRWIYNWIQLEPASAIKVFWNNITKSSARGIDTNMSKKSGLLHQLAMHIYKFIGIKRIYESKLTHVLSLELLRLTCDQIATLNNITQLLADKGVTGSIFLAAKNGIPEFLIGVINACPINLSCRDKLRRNFFFNAVKFRQAKVYSLIYGLVSKDTIASLVDSGGNTLLHMAAILEPSTQLNRLSGAALQMQRELQWFNELKHVMQPARWEMKNSNGMTARELFTESHKDLVKEGEKWMKETATSCTVVAALVVTIMFAASFTVPGGNNQNTGYPMFQDHKLFKLFIISDVVSLFSSTTSLLMFLGILTSRYAEDDFLKSLPTKLIIGLSMLFFSMAAMMITFSAAISVMLPGRLWIVIPVILFASIPVSLFVWLQSPLLYEIYISTYGSGIFERNMKRWI